MATPLASRRMPVLEPEELQRRERRLESLVLRLRERGYRITPQRLAILRVLILLPGHPTAEDIFLALAKDFPSMSLATVYKTLTMLKQEQEVLEIEFSSRDNRFDALTPTPHPHLICSRCGLVVDPPLPSLPRILEDMTQGTGFAIQTHRLDFFGLCPQCRS